MSAARSARLLGDAMRFDWDDWNRQFDAKMNALKQSLAEVDRIETAIAEANINMARDLRGMLGDVL